MSCNNFISKLLDIPAELHRHARLRVPVEAAPLTCARNRLFPGKCSFTLHFGLKKPRNEGMKNADLLSKGEKQKIEIARALATDADVYIMDEPTSGVDCFAENEIISRIFQELSDKKLIMIAHKLSTICKCDIIYYLESGSIAESGTHRELMEKKGQYYHMWCAQNFQPEESK